MNPVDLVRDLVRIPSDSGHEEAMADRMEQVFRGLGWSPVRSGRNVYALLGGAGPLLLLNSHTDTVPVGEGWTRAPHGAELVDGKIYGRGSNDAKGCLTAMIVGAARAFAKSPPPGRVCVAATCEEEISGKGLEVLIRELPRPDAAVIGEPTGLQPAVAQKGLMVLTLTAHGRSAHAAWGEGINAIQIAARDITALAAIRFDREHPALGFPSLHVTQVKGGARHNVIPDRCEFVVDVRTTPRYEPEEILAQVRALVQSQVEVRSQRLRSVDTDPAHPVVRAALAAHPGAQPFGSPTLSDWVFLPGIPAVKVGPGDSHRSHTPDEYVEAREIEEGTEFYERLIRAYFAQAEKA